MINFTRREEIAPSLLILLSILILAGTLAYMILVPKPGADRSARAWASGRRRLVDDISDTRAQTRRAQQAVRPRLWRSDPEAVTAAVLGQLTDQAKHRSLKLAAFRPERPQAFEGMTELRFSAQLSGSYAGIHAVLNSLDAPGSNLALRSAQIALSQTSGAGVTATIGLSAFVADDSAPTRGFHG